MLAGARGRDSLKTDTRDLSEGDVNVLKLDYVIVHNSKLTKVY